MQNKSQQTYKFLPRNIGVMESLQAQGLPQQIQAWKTEKQEYLIQNIHP